jgi:peptidoglycan hydrolase-like amidase
MLGRNEMPERVCRTGSAMRAAALAIVAGVCGASISIRPATGQAATPQSARTVRIGVFSLFRPTELVLRPVVAQGSSLVVDVGSSSLTLTANGSSLTVRESNGEVLVRSTSESPWMRGVFLRAHAFHSRSAESMRFWLEVPGKLRREYAGTLEIRAHGQILEAIVTMPLETAVASVVQAESPAGAGIEALKAQAVAARSFLVARQTSHVDFDFCDTTHCQFLRSPPAFDSPAAQAARATDGLILSWHDEISAQDQTIAAMYARSCGGRTRTLSEIGMKSGGYPYYAVRCVYCSHHPEIWRREALSETLLEPGSASSHEPKTERDRLNFNRIHGWGAMPSIAEGPRDSTDADEGRWIAGRGVGHGIGLCQLGAADMARHGASFAQILAHYYPNTRLATIPAR